MLRNTGDGWSIVLLRACRPGPFKKWKHNTRITALIRVLPWAYYRLAPPTDTYSLSGVDVELEGTRNTSEPESTQFCYRSPQDWGLELRLARWPRRWLATTLAE